MLLFPTRVVCINSLPTWPPFPLVLHSYRLFRSFKMETIQHYKERAFWAARTFLARNFGAHAPEKAEVILALSTLSYLWLWVEFNIESSIICWIARLTYFFTIYNCVIGTYFEWRQSFAKRKNRWDQGVPSNSHRPGLRKVEDSQPAKPKRRSFASLNGDGDGDGEEDIDAMIIRKATSYSILKRRQDRQGQEEASQLLKEIDDLVARKGTVAKVSLSSPTETFE